MSTTQPIFDVLVHQLPTIGTGASFIVILAAGLASGVASSGLAGIIRKNRHATAGKIEVRDVVADTIGIVASDETNAAEREKEAFKIAKQQVLKRIDQARDVQANKRSDAKLFSFIAGSLTFAQYIIGGVLASSFVKTTTSGQLIGSLGVLVLIASLLTQHYHPEVTAQTARTQADQLEALTRTSENRIVVIETTPDLGRKEMLELLEKFTTDFNAITLPPPTRGKSK